MTSDFWRSAVRDRPLSVLSVIIGCYVLGIVLATGFLKCELWCDESHHIQTIRLFVASFSLHTVKTYAEMHPPLAYMLYALAGKVFGDHVWIYRLVTLLCSSITIVLFFRVLRSLGLDNRKALAGIIVFLMNPYAAGLSVFIYSDMPGLMFLLLAALAALHRRPWLFCCAASCAILCRQYNVFIPLAIAVWSLVVWVRNRRPAILLFPCAAILSLVPVIALFLYWGDIAPPNGMAFWNPRRYQGFHPAFIVNYMAVLPVYTAPLIIYYRRRIFSLKRLGTAFAAGLVYWIVPVKPATTAITDHVHTFGFFHKAVQAVTRGNTSVEHFVFYVLFSLSLGMVSWLIAATVIAHRDGNQRSTEGLLFGGIITLCFCAVMICAPTVWEKYLVTLLPFLIGWILSCIPVKTSLPVRNEN
jgi:4-amino-4-deoxy-L-arabinose transferase-like glycosyltransferase